MDVELIVYTIALFLFGIEIGLLMNTLFEKILNKSVEMISDNGTVLSKSKNLYDNYIPFQPNSKSNEGYDCTIRSLCAYYNINWHQAFEILFKFTKKNQIMFNNEECLKIFFTSNGFNTIDIQDKSLSFSEVCKIYTDQGYKQFFILGNNHIVCCKNGNILDSFDSRINKAYAVIL